MVGGVMISCGQAAWAELSSSWNALSKYKRHLRRFLFMPNTLPKLFEMTLVNVIWRFS